MNKNRFYIDFHIIQTVPPSCVNRDDIGRPKTAIYGGVTRARVSSQSWKHAVRIMFEDIYSGEEKNRGYRTKNAVNLIGAEIQKLDSDISDDETLKLSEQAINLAGLKTTSKGGKVATGALFFISSVQAKKLAELAVSGDKDKKNYKAAINSEPSVDIALFGRMAADDPELNVDAACQVAHAISTHKVQNEYDYFTAVDDCSPEDNAGAGHLGTNEFNSSTLYRYATINVTDLKNKVGNVGEAVRNFAEAFIRSMPTGKENSYANRTLPDAIYVTIRKDQPVNLCGAFEKPVFSTEGYSEKSIKALADYSVKIYEDYCGKPEVAFEVGTDLFVSAEKVNVDTLLEKIYEYVSKEVV